MHILREIEKIARSLSVIYDNHHRELGIKRGQYVYIKFVNEKPGLSQLDMVNQLSIDKTTVTKALQKLVAAGFVFRQRDPEDGRISRVYPTQQGRAIYKQIKAEEERLSNQLLSSFTEKEQFDLEGHLLKISKDLESEWKNSRNYLTVGVVRAATYEDLRPFEDVLDYQMDRFYQVCEYRDQVVGVLECSLEPHPEYKKVRWNQGSKALYLEMLYVLKPFRNKGFGYLLMKKMKSLCDENGAESMRVIADEKNIPMLKLVNLFEFKFIGEHVSDSGSQFCFEKRNR